MKKEKGLKDKKVKSINKTKKYFIIGITLFLLIVGGITIYLIFFKDSNVNYSNRYNAAFKTNDGRKLNFYTYSDEKINKEVLNTLKNRYLKVCQENNTQYNLYYCDAARNDNVGLEDYLYKIFDFNSNQYLNNEALNNMSSNYRYHKPYINEVYEYAKFEDKIIGIYEFHDGTNYGVFAGNDLSKESQYPYEYYFLVDFNNGKVIQYNEEMYILDHTLWDIVTKIGRDVGSTYFAKKENNSLEYKVYTTDFKYLGNVLTEPRNLMDDDGNVYVINNGIISVYNKEGNKVRSLRNIGNIIDFTVFRNKCLALVYEDSNLYMYDFSDESKVKLNINETGIEKCFFHNYDDSIKNNEVIIYGVNEEGKNVSSSIGDYVVYDYTTKTFKHTNGSQVYKNEKLTIELDEYDIFNEENGGVTKKYHLYDDGKTIDVEVRQFQIDDGVFEITHNNTIYILDESNKKIIAKYTAKDKVDYTVTNAEYDENNLRNNGIWFFVYDGDKVVLVANRTNGEILKFTDNYPNGKNVINNELYLQFNNEMTKYDINGRELKNVKYDKIISACDMCDELFTIKNNDIYNVSLINNFKEEKLIKIDTYKYDNKNVDLYKLNDEKYIYIDGKIESLYNSDDMKEDDTYVVYSYGGGMCNDNLLINKKTKTVEGNGSNLGYIKTSSGYFYTTAECVTDFGESYIYTSSWKKIGEKFIFNSKEFNDKGNVYVVNNSTIESRNINGDVVSKSKKYEEINAGIMHDNALYAIVRDNNKVYLVNFNSNLEEQRKIEINTSIDWYTSYLEIENGKISITLYSENDENDYFVYDNISNKLEKVIKPTE